MLPSWSTSKGAPLSAQIARKPWLPLFGSKSNVMSFDEMSALWILDERRNRPCVIEFEGAPILENCMNRSPLEASNGFPVLQPSSTPRGHGLPALQVPVWKGFVESSAKRKPSATVAV